MNLHPFGDHLIIKPGSYVSIILGKNEQSERDKY